ncbi:hypothetical protein X777_06122 [Ooceraea biroi]|uniref:Uncharacterized protein n=1 Tax=Ooceraea biroi TaxID=2015173 RepID=A0A026X2F3_OOCBI|nr:hypothetical protein X777_06122 [Ooceraea biroi]
MKRDIARFDTSDYASDNVYGRFKVPGLMKDENNGAIMTIVEKVDAKIAQFSYIAFAETKDASNAIRASECFNAHNIIDCELLALVFSKPM